MREAEKKRLAEIQAIKSRLREQGYDLYSLRADRLKLYLGYRVDQLAKNRTVMLPTEQYYLLTETGPSNLRFDPEMLDQALDVQIVVNPVLSSDAEAGEMISIKEQMVDVITQASHSKNTCLEIKKQLEVYVGPLRVISTEPFLYEGMYDGRKIYIYWLNSDWLLPNQNLMKMLKKAYKGSAYPIIVARKIHGALFPFLKEIGAIGFNTYATLVDDESMDKLASSGAALEKYRRPYFDMRIELFDRYTTPSDYLEDTDSPLIRFLTTHMPIHIATSDFLTDFNVTKHSFEGYIETLRPPKLRKNLATWHTRRSRTITRLQKAKLK